MSNSNPTQLNNRTLSLAESVFDSTITTAEFEELVGQLTQDDLAVGLFAEFVNLQSVLRQTFLVNQKEVSQLLDSSESQNPLDESLDHSKSASNSLLE